MVYNKHYIDKLNNDIKLFQQVFPIEKDMNKTLDGVSRLVMLDRYSFKDSKHKTTSEGDFVLLTVKDDPKFPARGYGYIKEFDKSSRKVTILVDEEFRSQIEDLNEQQSGLVVRNLNEIDKPLELYYEQIAKRNAYGLSRVEKTKEKQDEWFNKFYEILSNMDFVPAGRVLYGAGADTNVTYFNCYVLPFPKDSRDGIAEHRKTAAEIMSRGGGVGTNGSTLRPKNSLARGVNGKSSGAVSWLDDIAKLTHLIEQGGSRRGAQMIMLSDWHPDILEFIISKIQNPNILRFIIDNTKDEQIKSLSRDKLKFTPFSQEEAADLNAAVVAYENIENYKEANRVKSKLKDGGTYSVNNPEFLTGANISVAITKEFMETVENDDYYELKFPDVESYNENEMEYYNNHWHEVGDVREWPLPIRTYRKIKAKELWNLINIAATYSAEPGIFFIDNANEMTNARAYGQKVVATNPCLHPDTKVVINNEIKTIKEVAENIDKIRGEKIKTVFNGKQIDDEIIDAFKTKENAELIELEIIDEENNKHILKLTPDHRVFTENRGWVEAQNLTEEDDLVVSLT